MFQSTLSRTMLPRALPRQTLAFRTTSQARSITIKPRASFNHTLSSNFPQFNGLPFSKPIGLRPSKTIPLAPRLALLFSTTPTRLVITPKGTIDPKKEEKLRNEKLERQPPDEVTSNSTTTPMFERNNPDAPEKDVSKELQQELNTVRETFSMKDVPKDLSLMGVLGLTPYVATSATSLFLAWDLEHAATNETTPYMVSAETARSLLDIVEPIQLGYGAVLLSFLGAIHWGLEFSGYGGRFGYKRYAIGILAPMLSWPTTFFTYDAALVTQFIGFTGMYFADALATKWGWAPSWYTNYRFVLTFVVGGCIIIILIARSKIGDQSAGHATLAKNKYYNHLQRIQASELDREQQEILEQSTRALEEKQKAEDKKKEEVSHSKSIDTHRSKERAEKGALSQAERATSGGKNTTPTTERRRERDAEETEDEKEEGGPKKAKKTVDITKDKGKEKGTFTQKGEHYSKVDGEA